MAPTSARAVLFTGAAGLGLSLLSALPAGAHPIGGGGLLAGLAHPLTGLDHLLLLVGVGAAAATIDAALVGWALGGALVGAVFGSLGGSLPAAETLAALAVSLVGLLLLFGRNGRASALPGGLLVSAAVAVHAMLHGHEAPAQALWWLGSGLASVAVLLGSWVLLRRLGAVWTSRLAVGLCLAGGALALIPVL
ncbi:MAG: HupE/UreJ family protein [Cyanobacteriota bacterium]|nr:HupE/UreJ family protein [Cyanobacteriota bacterium]